MRTVFALVLCAAAVFGQGGRRAPGFCLIDSTGQWRDLYDYRGKPVILEFMQTTCPHCANFVSILEKVQLKYGDRVQILAVVVPPDNPSTMTQYVTGHKIKYPVLLDQGQVAASYVCSPNLSFPTVYLIDPNGEIRSAHSYGPLAKDVFEGNGLLNEVDRIFGASSMPARKK